jgi:hypothetical protein
MRDGPDAAWDQLSSSVVPVSRQVRCDIGFVLARVRLLKLLHLGFLHSACVAAYESALVMHHGRAARRPAPLVVTITEPEPGIGTVAVPLRWAVDPRSGGLGRVADAELGFTVIGSSTVARFDGTFRLPAPHHATRAEHVLVAVSCADSLLARVAAALSWDDEPMAGLRDKRKG